MLSNTDAGQSENKDMAVVSLHHSWHPLLAAIHHLTLKDGGRGTQGEEGDFIAVFY